MYICICCLLYMLSLTFIKAYCIYRKTLMIAATVHILGIFDFTLMVFITSILLIMNPLLSIIIAFTSPKDYSERPISIQLQFTSHNILVTYYSFSSTSIINLYIVPTAALRCISIYIQYKLHTNCIRYKWRNLSVIFVTVFTSLHLIKSAFINKGPLQWSLFILFVFCAYFSTACKPKSYNYFMDNYACCSSVYI